MSLIHKQLRRKCFPSFVLKEVFVFSYLHINDSYQILSKFVQVYQSYKCHGDPSHLPRTPLVIQLPFIHVLSKQLMNFSPNSNIIDTPFYDYLNQWSQLHIIIFFSMQLQDWVFRLGYTIVYIYPKLCNQVRSLSLFRWRTLTLLKI